MSGRAAARRTRETVEQQRSDMARRLAFDGCDAGVLVVDVLLDLGLCSDAGCWPSLAELSDRTGLGRRAVRTRLGCLLGAGIIADTKRRKGSTRRITVWGLGDAVIEAVKVSLARSESDDYSGRKRRPLSNRLVNLPGRDRPAPAHLREQRAAPDWAVDDTAEGKVAADE